jgi:hypothetical protein
LRLLQPLHKHVLILICDVYLKVRSLSAVGKVIDSNTKKKKRGGEQGLSGCGLEEKEYLESAHVTALSHTLKVKMC